MFLILCRVPYIQSSKKVPSSSPGQVDLLAGHDTFNPLSTKIQIQILQTDLHTFLLRIVERIWFKIKVFSLW